MAKRDARLNSISRFSKRSPRLILESHGSCEVPAGCGGVVLRWRNPDRATPLRVYLYSPGNASAWIDGEPLSTGRLELTHGLHCLAIELSELPTDRGALLFAATNAPEESRPPAADVEPSVFTRVFSGANPAWRYTTEDPGEGPWRQPGWDASGWSPVVLRAIPELGPDDPNRWSYGTVAALGARAVGPETPAERIWIRRELEVRPEQPVPRSRS